MVYFPRYTPKRYHSHFSCFSKWPNLFFLLSHLVSLHPVMSPNRIFFPPGIIHSQSCTILPQTHIQFFYSYHSLRCKMQLAWSKWPSRKILFFFFPWENWISFPMQSIWFLWGSWRKLVKCQASVGLLQGCFVSSSCWALCHHDHFYFGCSITRWYFNFQRWHTSKSGRKLLFFCL